MMFQQFGATKCVRMFGGLAALTLLLATSACDQADPFGPASAQAAQVTDVRSADGAGITAEDPGFTSLGDAGFSNASFNTTESGKGATAFGYLTKATANYTSAFGGYSEANNTAATAMGHKSVASGIYSVAAGFQAMASGSYSFATGANTSAGGNFSTAMGSSSAANGDYSVAMGRNAKAPHKGSFVFSDASTAADFSATTANQVRIRAAGGVQIYTNDILTRGVEVADGEASWSTLSDVNTKESFRDLDEDEVLEKLSALRIPEWSYIGAEGGVRHVGPMAQDFYAAFGLGTDPLRISTVDADGIALVAIQALEQRNSELRETVERHEQELDRLNQRLERLERALLHR